MPKADLRITHKIGVTTDLIATSDSTWEVLIGRNILNGLNAAVLDTSLIFHVK